MNKIEKDKIAGATRSSTTGIEATPYSTTGRKPQSFLPGQDGAFYACNTCDTRLFVKDSDYWEKTFVTQCQGCNRNLLVQRITFHNQMEIVELTGCHYQGNRQTIGFTEQATNPNFSLINSATLEDLDWLSRPGGESASAETRIESNPIGQFTAESFIPNLVSGWEVECAGGRKYQFQYFSVLRKWIQEGKIKASDTIQPEGDKCYRIDEYPGTADLFGNFAKRSEALKALSPRPVYRQRLFPKIIKWTFRSLALLTFLVSAAAAPTLYAKWVLYSGAEFVAGLTVDKELLPNRELIPSLISANSFARSSTPDDLKTAEKEYLKALTIDPVNAEALSGLTEAWTEISHLSQDNDLLNRAEKLLQYNGALYPKNPNFLKSRARHQWRSGKASEAMKTIWPVAEVNHVDPALHELTAFIATDLKDYAKATIEFDKALQIEPQNDVLLQGIVNVFKVQSKYIEAAAYQLRRVQLNPTDRRREKELITLYRKANDLQSIETYYRDRLLATSGKLKETYSLALLEILDEQKNEEELLQAALAFVSEFPDSLKTADVRAKYIKANEIAETSVGEFDPSSPFGSKEELQERRMERRARQLRQPRRTSRRR